MVGKAGDSGKLVPTRDDLGGFDFPIYLSITHFPQLCVIAQRRWSSSDFLGKYMQIWYMMLHESARRCVCLYSHNHRCHTTRRAQRPGIDTMNRCSSPGQIKSSHHSQSISITGVRHFALLQPVLHEIGGGWVFVLHAWSLSE